MRDAVRIGILNLLFLWSFIPNALASGRQTPVKHDPLIDPVMNYEESGHDFSATLWNVAQKYHLPIGLDLEAPLKPKLIFVHVSGGLVADVLNAVVAQEPNYKWVEVDGVVNVMPRQNPASMLDLQISNFRVTNATLFDVHAAIVSLPEVRAWLDRNRLEENSPMAMDVLIGKGFQWPRISVNLHNASMREILNKIVSLSGFSSWTVGRWGQQDQYFIISVS
jgi:hypothetical protein